LTTVKRCSNWAWHTGREPRLADAGRLRLSSQAEFAKRHIRDDPLINLVTLICQVFTPDLHLIYT
jgi:hypothetical protein